MKVHFPRTRKPLTRSKPWRFAQGFFLAAGLLALGFAAYGYAARYTYQAYENRECDRAPACKNKRQPAGESTPSRSAGSRRNASRQES